MSKSTWVIDPTHSEVQFKVKHLVISTVSGSFKSFSGQMEAEGSDFQNAQISFEADVNSIDTNQTDRDNHLRSADFFDAENHPKLIFRSTSWLGEKLQGNLTIKGNTHPVELDVDFGGTATDLYGHEKAGFELSGKINRKDFGLTWSAVTEVGGAVVADQVKLMANVQLVKK